MSYVSQYFGPVTLLLWLPPPPTIIIIHKSMIYGSHHYFSPTYLCPMFSTAVIKHHQSRCNLLNSSTADDSGLQGTSHCTPGCVVPYILKEHSVIIYYPSNCWEPLTEQHNITAHKPCILTLNLGSYGTPDYLP